MHEKSKLQPVLFLLFISFGYVAGFLASYVSYDFSEPQPADKKNIYEFPIEFHRKWLADTFTSSIEFTDPLDGKTGYLDNSNGPILPAGYLNHTGLHGTNPQGNEDSSYFFIDKKMSYFLFILKKK